MNEVEVHFDGREKVIAGSKSEAALISVQKDTKYSIQNLQQRAIFLFVTVLNSTQSQKEEIAVGNCMTRFTKRKVVEVAEDGMENVDFQAHLGSTGRKQFFQKRFKGDTRAYAYNDYFRNVAHIKITFKFEHV